MEKHLELSDEEFLRQFGNCELPALLFSHEAHIRLAWINIQKYGIELAKERIQSQILKFVESVGERGKYNKTLTIAALQIVNHFIQLSNSNNFPDFILEYPQLKTDFKRLVSSHYTVDIFSSELAKYEFIEPDKISF